MHDEHLKRAERHDVVDHEPLAVEMFTQHVACHIAIAIPLDAAGDQDAGISRELSHRQSFGTEASWS